MLKKVNYPLSVDDVALSTIYDFRVGTTVSGRTGEQAMTLIFEVEEGKFVGLVFPELQALGLQAALENVVPLVTAFNKNKRQN